MKRSITILMALLVGMWVVSPTSAKVVAYERDRDYGAYLIFDRYLDVEIWTEQDEYYEGEDIDISFRASKDCYVAIYNIDTRGRVSLLYPVDEQDDFFIRGGHIYNLPDKYDDYDLTVRGPEGVEYLQIVASREPFPLDDWDPDMICDDDPYDFMSFINAAFFGCDFGCRRAYDLTSFMVKEWDQAYFRPVYDYDCPHWSMCGSVYIDYPFGASVYVNGIYWGCAPLYIPRIYYGYHWITIYDPWGYCWEDRIGVVRRRTVILDNTIVKTKTSVKSRYRDVRARGYLNPAKNGYSDYAAQVRAKKEIRQSSAFKTRMSSRTASVSGSTSRYSGKKTSYSASRSSRSRSSNMGSASKQERQNRSSRSSTVDRRDRSGTGSDSRMTRKSSGSKSSRESTRSKSSKVERKSSSKSTRNSATVKQSSKRSNSSKATRKSPSSSSGSRKVEKKSSGSGDSSSGTVKQSSSTRSSSNRSTVSNSGSSGTRKSSRGRR